MTKLGDMLIRGLKQLREHLKNETIEDLPERRRIVAPTQRIRKAIAFIESDQGTNLDRCRVCGCEAWINARLPACRT